MSSPAEHTSPAATITADAGLEAVAACLFCGSGNAEIAADGVRDDFFKADDGVFRYLRCTDCGSLWLAERPVGARLIRAYESYYTHSEPKPAPTRPGVRGVLRDGYLRARFADKPSLLDRLVAAAVAGRDNSGIDELLRFAPKAPAKLLDYGCGSGQYLLWMKPYGHELHGAEYDPHLLGNLAAAGITVHDVTTLGTDRWQAEFDHITLSHVLEHVPDPVALLSRLFGWLKPGGGLYLVLPNGGATGLTIFGSHWRGLEAPRHFALPSRDALHAALEAAGFIVERQHIDRSARSWVWGESIGVVPPGERAAIERAIAQAPPEDTTNAEFLTFLARRPT
jgi:SAM-dependent methyltransferase